MKKAILSQNIHWNSAYKSLYKRDVFNSLLSKLEMRHIQVLQGIRRSGKSSLFKLIINHLMQSIDAKSILYINLDDPFFINYSNDPTSFYEIIQTAETLTQQKIKYLFLDEVQAISGWEKYVKSAYDSEMFTKIFVTGSNSSLLNGEYATLLTGRYLATKVNPLSFSELMQINKINNNLELHSNLPKVLNLLDEMLAYGSFVEVYAAPENIKRDLIASYYETILLKDCVTNFSIRDVKSFKELSFYLISNIASLFSYSSLSRAIKISDVSVKDYIFALESSYLFTELRHFSYSLKEQSNTSKKLYLTDNSFMKLSFSFSNNHGKLLENLVFTELQKTGAEIYFYNKDQECDFIVKDGEKLTAIQVCYELNEQNQKREINGLLKLPFPVDKRLIITYNQNITINSIKAIPFWEYFFDSNSPRL